MADLDLIDKPPCKVQELLIFDAKNLEKYIEFLGKCTKVNLDYTTQVNNYATQIEKDVGKKMEIIYKVNDFCEELSIKISAQNFKIGEVENSIEQQGNKILKFDEKFEKLEDKVNEISDVKDKMLQKIGDIDYLLEERVKHLEMIEVI